ncbi:sulfatase-like hydrolase/transferase [Alistipes sp. D31t1_170403_E11]|uniref:sulfatase family protein n=1 Tax=Alistipes sp. D31t1_170403_E11 TaxID=2787128 RepID=UPI00189AE90E|nr:sulfatase-like hydrolase/transferase [Alistipes sp. D31t1_170403_E11]
MTNLNYSALAASLAALTVAADASASPENKPAAGKRPGIIVIMTDQQTAGAMSCAGNPWVETPAMDALAADGVRFTRAYCPYPLSGPCRASLITGRMPFEVGAFDNADRPYEADMQAGIGHRIAGAGYECLYAGKWHVPEINLPDSGTGFRRISKMGDPTLADACDAALKEYDGRKPLFLVASLLNPHEICEYGRNETLQYGELEPFPTAECPNLPANFMPSTYAPEALALESAASPRYHNTATYTQDDWRRYLYAYYRFVERVDREVGRIVEVLKVRGVYDDSVIIFLSDHGDGVAAHGWNQKWNLQEEVVNVPLIVKPPKGTGLRGVCNDEALSNVGLDLYVTVCDYAGVVPDPERYRGRSLRPVAEGRQAELHDVVFVETLLSGVGMRGWSIVGKRYKYVLYQWGRNREALYDLETDPGEMVNLAVDRRYEGELRHMRRALYDWGVRIGDPKLVRNMRPFARPE